MDDIADQEDIGRGKNVGLEMTLGLGCNSLEVDSKGVNDKWLRSKGMRDFVMERIENTRDLKECQSDWCGEQGLSMIEF